jgi:hypothetical protein
MDPSLEDLGLSPDLSRLPREVRNLIRHGSGDGQAGCSDALVEVCAAMLSAGYGIDELWMVLSDPASSISKGFFEKNGKQAEAWLEWIIRDAYEAVNKSNHSDE